MQIDQSLKGAEFNLEAASLEMLRVKWCEVWGRNPHYRIGRKMLIRSIRYKIQLKSIPSFQKRLDELVKAYKRNPKCFNRNRMTLKPGTRLIRDWNGKRYSVLVQKSGYQYKDKIYNSLSQIASEITCTRWNGLVFFGLKKREAK